MSQIPTLEDVRKRAQMRIGDIRGTLIQRRGGRQPFIGNGAILSNVMNRANSITTRIQERKPGMIPMVKEFKPGDRLKTIMKPQISPQVQVIEQRSALNGGASIPKKNGTGNISVSIG